MPEILPAASSWQAMGKRLARAAGKIAGASQ